MAGLPNGQRFDHHRHSVHRPALNSHTSNSVPSTPQHKPLDLHRRHSRSPSPGRNLSNQSPRSVVSEAVGGTNGSLRGAPVVCKFETGDEFRKRRMPYIDGAQQELGPPKKEPRRTLEPDEQEKLSGDMRELYDRLLPSQESEERRAKLLHKLDRILNEEWPGNNIRVNVFGSSGNLLSSTDSDVDICITTPLKKLESMHALAGLLDKHGMEKVVCRAAAKVPIVKCWDPELELASDLNVNNPLALQNTRLIKLYVQIDDRVRPLAKIIKYWTKRRILNDAAFGATISSYTWICLIISFLQRRDPPILPSLQKMPGYRLPSDTGKESPFADDLDALEGFGSTNKESLGELLFQFFRHYGFEFEFSKYVVSVKEGRLLSRKEKGWDPSNAREDKEARHRLCVEEPFTVHRNLGNTADEYAWHGIHLEIRRAFDLLNDGLQLEKCCEQYEFPKEEKPIFQKPPPKPKPTLTRSASQSGQSNRDPGSTRSRKGNNRNASAQRANNRRASSGASYSNQRLPFSPPLGTPTSDYFQLKGSLHEQLFQQYQFLQAQQDALRTQLAHQQQQQQAQARVGDLASSPRPRQFAANGLTSPSSHPPQTAPLLPNYLFQYPTRYPPPSPVSQARAREGTSTNPSSPSLVAAVPGLTSGMGGRRQAQRASVPDGNIGSVRSQSQPGRSLPQHLALQPHLHPQFDMASLMAGHFQNTRAVSQAYHQGHTGMQLPFGPFSAVPQGADNPIPKEYVGYHLGQSPQLSPQQYALANAMPPPMSLRDPPARPRRVTPDLMPPTVNGRHSSRSPSPLGPPGNAERLASQTTVQSPISYGQPLSAVAPSSTPADIDLGGPLIVNGSNRGSAPRPTERVTEAQAAPLHIQTDVLIPSQPLPLREHYENTVHDLNRQRSSPHLSPAAKSERVFSPMSPPNGTSNHVNGVKEHYHENTPLSAAPLLSPVVELRTPSPTQSRGFDMQQSPRKTNGEFLKSATNNANTKQFQRETNGSSSHRNDPRNEERRKSVPMPPPPKPDPASRGQTSQTPTQSTSNNWQQVSSGKKGHKKNSKSTNGSRTTNGSGGQPLPANESERKGG